MRYLKEPIKIEKIFKLAKEPHLKMIRSQCNSVLYDVGLL